MNRHDVKKAIYLDYAASTPVSDEVREAMAPYWSEVFANPEALYRGGVEASRAVEDARGLVAVSLGIHTDEVVFTSGGTESNNLAIFGVVEALEAGGRALSEMHIVTTAIEHSSVLAPIRALERRGVGVSIVGVTPEGVVDLHALKEALRPETVLVSVMHANNEIGTIQPVAEVARLLRKHAKTMGTEKPVFHVDASQSPLYVDVSVPTMGADVVTFGAQKIYGPKGCGVLVVRRGTPLAPRLYGGDQEQGLRAGTPAVPLVVGCATALSRAVFAYKEVNKKVGALRDHMIDRLMNELPDVVLNGSRDRRLANNVNVTMKGIDGEWLVLQLDARGVAVSTRSACQGGSDEHSHVLEALGVGEEAARSSLRITLGRETTKEEIDTVVDILLEIVRENRHK